MSITFNPSPNSHTYLSPTKLSCFCFSFNPLAMEACKSHLMMLFPLLFFLSQLFTVVSIDHHHHKAQQNIRLLPDTSSIRYLQTTNGKPFKIALFADLHFGEAESTDWGPLQDVNSARVMNQVLHDENPGICIKVPVLQHYEVVWNF